MLHMAYFFGDMPGRIAGPADIANNTGGFLIEGGTVAQKAVSPFLTDMISCRGKAYPILRKLMPSFRSRERTAYNEPVYKDVCNPITGEFRSELYGNILALYGEMERTGKAEIVRNVYNPAEPEFEVSQESFLCNYQEMEELFERCIKQR